MPRVACGWQPVSVSGCTAKKLIFHHLRRHDFSLRLCKVFLKIALVLHLKDNRLR